MGCRRLLCKRVRDEQDERGWRAEGGAAVALAPEKQRRLVLFIK